MVTDGTKDTQDKTQDASSAAGSDVAKPSSETTISPDIEKEVQKRVSDILAKRGDKAKTLEERLTILETENKSLKDSHLSATASKYGLTVEQVKQVGVDNPERLEQLAALFGKKNDASTEASPKGVLPKAPDSGKTSGGSDNFASLSPKERVSAADKKLRTK